MSINLPTGDPRIEKLIADLTILVGQHGKSSFQVEQFLEEHEDDSWTDPRSGELHYFSEIGELLAELMEGITNQDSAESEDEEDGADWWKADQDDGESWKS